MSVKSAEGATCVIATIALQPEHNRNGYPVPRLEIPPLLAKKYAIQLNLNGFSDAGRTLTPIRTLIALVLALWLTINLSFLETQSNPNPNPNPNPDPNPERAHDASRG